MMPCGAGWPRQKYAVRADGETRRQGRVHTDSDRCCAEREAAAREHPKLVVTRWIAQALCVASSVFAVLAMIFDAPFGWPALAGLGFGAGIGVSAGASWGLRRGLDAAPRPSSPVPVTRDEWSGARLEPSLRETDD